MAVEVERHPFEPFLPEGAKVLLLGSFPPQKKRWSMEFYYPNFINDFWRIIKEFCAEKGIAMFDTATAVRRLKDNASDKFLEVVEPTDIPALLRRIPLCGAVVVTGEKAAQTLCAAFGTEAPAVGEFSQFSFEGRNLRLYRMPSTSRAYPLPIQKKADVYRRLFADLGIS